MPLHDLMCQKCEKVTANIYIPMDEVMGFAQTCECGGDMNFDFRNRTVSKRTGSHKFQECTLYHTRRLDGTREPRKINSLHDIRMFEKEHQDQQVCVEAFSYDSQAHIPEPVAQDKPTVMTDDQKRDFMEKFRDMNIKDERSARDY